MKARLLGRLVAGALAGTVATVTGQALYTVRRRDLPSVHGGDASGCEGRAGDTALSVIACGDSTLTGPGLDDPADIWIRQALRSIAGKRSLRVELQSLAAGGSRLADVLRDQVPELQARSPSVAVIVAGTNDAINHTPLRIVRQSVDRLLADAVPHVDQVVVGSVGDLANIARVRWPLAGVLRLRGRRVDRAIRRVVARYPNVHYIDVSQTDRHFRHGGHTLFTSDRFHPNRDGHALWAEVAEPVIDAAIGAALTRR